MEEKVVHLIYQLRVRLVLLGCCIKSHIVVNLSFTEARLLTYQCLNCNYFEVQDVTILKVSINNKSALIEFNQTLSWYVEARLSI